MGSARERFSEVISAAVLAGACSAGEGWHMTPGEMSACIEALGQRRREEMRAMDTLAWLIGQYAAVGINAPGRYPARPDRVRERAAGDREMQRMMERMAREF